MPAKLTEKEIQQLIGKNAAMIEGTRRTGIRTKHGILHRCKGRSDKCEIRFPDGTCEVVTWKRAVVLFENAKDYVPSPPKTGNRKTLKKKTKKPAQSPEKVSPKKPSGKKTTTKVARKVVTFKQAPPSTIKSPMDISSLLVPSTTKSKDKKCRTIDEQEEEEEDDEFDLDTPLMQLQRPVIQKVPLSRNPAGKIYKVPVRMPSSNISTKSGKSKKEGRNITMSRKSRHLSRGK